MSWHRMIGRRVRVFEYSTAVRGIGCSHVFHTTTHLHHNYKRPRGWISKERNCRSFPLLFSITFQTIPLILSLRTSTTHHIWVVSIYGLPPERTKLEGVGFLPKAVTAEGRKRTSANPGASPCPSMSIYRNGVLGDSNTRWRYLWGRDTLRMRRLALRLRCSTRGWRRLPS